MPSGAANFQFGYEHHLYVAADANQLAPVCLDSFSESSTTGANRSGGNPINWYELAVVRDTSITGQPTTIDITTRLEAREGIIAQAITGTQRNLEFQLRPYKVHETDAVDSLDKIMVLLEVIAGGGNPTAIPAVGNQIAVMELDAGPKPANPPAALQLGTAFASPNRRARGIVGNATISISQPKPVQGLYVIDFTVAFSTFTHAIYIKPTDGFATRLIPALT